MPGISIYNKCNNNCLMCTNPDEFFIADKDISYSSLSKRIARFAKGKKEFLENNRDTFYITGGEPTLAKHCMATIKKINLLFPGSKIVLLSNGRIFSYASYAKSFFAETPGIEIVVPIHGHSASLHDKVTRTKGSFRQTINGLKNIFYFKKPGDLVEVRIVIHRLNYRYLEHITNLIRKEFPSVSRLVYIFFEVEGQAYKNIEFLKLTYAQARPFVNRVFNMIKEMPDIRFYHFPLCTLPVKFFPYIWRTLPDFEVGFVKECGRCSVKKACLGFHKGYLKSISKKEANPLSLKVNFSYNWYHPISKV